MTTDSTTEGGSADVRSCASCGADLRATARFCPACGSPTPGDAAAPDAPRPPAPVVPVVPAGKRARTAPPAGAVATAASGPAATAPGGRSNRRAAVVVAAIVAALLVVVGVLVLAGGSDEPTPEEAAAPTSSTATALPPATTSPPAGGVGETSGTPSGGGAGPVSQPIQPQSIVASNEREGVNLRCPPHNFITYSATNLIDGNMDTGWGASSSDGTGQSATVRFAGPRHLTSVALTPGYVKFGPRFDQGCTAVSAFPFNRFVTQVEYQFDDGSTTVQSFENTPGLQEMAVDEVTTSVVIRILGTQRPTNADDDTIISEAEFEGYIE